MKKNKLAKLYVYKKKTTSAMFLILFIFLTIFALCLIGMIFWGLLTSLKSEADFKTNVIGFPDVTKSFAELCQLANYRVVFTEFNFTYNISYYTAFQPDPVVYSGNVQFIHLLINSIIYSVGGALVLALIPCLTAYLCAKYDFKLSKIIFAVFTVVMCIPIVGTTPSMITFVRNVGLYDSMLGNFIMKASASGMYFFIFYAFFKTQSDAYREAAEIDGASEGKIMFGIYIPLARKIIFTVFLIQFVALWNDYQTTNLYLPGSPTLAYGVYELSKDTKTAGIPEMFKTVPIKITASMLVAVPVTIIFAIFKDKLMGDISLGGIKE